MHEKRYPYEDVQVETIGKRIAKLRTEHGWTQQSLADRLAISRVAISHIEIDLTLPSERTVTLLAGVFKQTPFELVSGTTYPLAKAERLPEVACSYTQLEMELALLHNDLAWLSRLAEAPNWLEYKEEILLKWRMRLVEMGKNCSEEREREMIAASQEELAAIGDPDRG